MPGTTMAGSCLTRKPISAVNFEPQAVGSQAMRVRTRPMKILGADCSGTISEQQQFIIALRTHQSRFDVHFPRAFGAIRWIRDLIRVSSPDTQVTTLPRRTYD